MTLDKENAREKKLWWILSGIIIVLAAIRLLWNINVDCFTFLDEYATFDVSVGFMHTGEFRPWDFHHQCLSVSETYTRAWPHTVLLAFCFKLFGISVIIGKVLSALLGITFIASVFYVSKKIYNSYYISTLSCLFLLANTTVVELFRQIRMYGLWLLLNFWFLYFSYMCLTRTNSFVHLNGWKGLIKKNLDFSIFYLMTACLFFFLSFETHVNTLVSCVGILCFFLYLMCRKRERKYAVAISIALLVLAFMWLCYLYILHVGKIGILLPIWDFFGSLRSGFVGWNQKPNMRYYDWFLDYLGNRYFMYFCLIASVFGLIRNFLTKNEKYQFTLYSMMIVCSTLFCFIYILDRYYQARYMIYLVPFLTMLMASGVTELASSFKNKMILVFMVGFCVFVSVYHMSIQYIETYNNPNICYHRNVYEQIEQDADEVPIAIAGYDIRDYYGVQVFDEYETAAFDREHDMEVLWNFASLYPRGYVAVETAKMNGITESMKTFMQRYSERIAGEGIDEWNINVSRYCFLYPQIEDSASGIDTNMEKSGIGFSTTKRGKETEIEITVDSSLMEKGTKLLCLNFEALVKNETKTLLCYQLVLPENKEGLLKYSVAIKEADAIIELRSDYMLYFENETYKEATLY